MHEARPRRSITRAVAIAPVIIPGARRLLPYHLHEDEIYEGTCPTVSPLFEIYFWILFSFSACRARCTVWNCNAVTSKFLIYMNKLNGIWTRPSLIWLKLWPSPIQVKPLFVSQATWSCVPRPCLRSARGMVRLGVRGIGGGMHPNIGRIAEAESDGYQKWPHISDIYSQIVSGKQSMNAAHENNGR